MYSISPLGIIISPLFFAMTFRVFRSVLMLVSFVTSLGVFSVLAVTYPTHTPAGEEAGGYFHKWFMNMFTSACPPGQVIAGFQRDPANPYAPGNGIPICVLVESSTGSASDLTGSLVGPTGYLPMWGPSGTTLVASRLYQAGNTVTMTGNLHLSGRATIVDGTQRDGYVLTSDAYGLASWKPHDGGCIPGHFSLATPPIIPPGNTCHGTGVAPLQRNTFGEYNTGIGSNALRNNSTGNRNTAVGAEALTNNIIGSGNVAIGYRALWRNVSHYHVAIGYRALANFYEETGMPLKEKYYPNTAYGAFALEGNTGG